MVILLLLLLASPSDIKVHTQEHLIALQNISALQVNSKQSYRVGVFNGESRPAPIPYKGLHLGAEWLTVLQDSQSWELIPNNDHYSFQDQCWWTEVNHGNKWAGWVPCEGEVYVDGSDIRKIVQHLTPDRMITSATITIDYGWVELKARRLVPLSITLSGIWRNQREETISAHWIDYHEWASESVVKDVDDEGRREVKRVELNEGLVIPETPHNEAHVGSQVAFQSKPTLTSPEGLTTSETKIRSKWRRFLRALVHQSMYQSLPLLIH